MKLITIVNARLALQKLVEQPLPLRTAWQVMQLVDRCNIHLQFYGDRRRQLGADPDPDQLDELNSMEISELNATVRIQLPIGSNVQLSDSEVKSLQPFVEFTEE